MTHAEFNLLLAVGGFPTVIAVTWAIARHLVYSGDPQPFPYRSPDRQGSTPEPDRSDNDLAGIR